jgi:alkylation response protein AidB-like acyl-CoA dehydrogenase
VDAEPAARRRATSVAKVVSGLSGQTVSRNGLQIHGGYGMTDEYAVSHHYRRLLVLEKQYGGIDVYSGILATGEMQA